jgi:hypothetical protein
MVARRTLGTHRCEPDTSLADNRSTDLRLVAMRNAAPPRHAVEATHHVPHGGTKEQQMRMITIGQHHSQFAADVNDFLSAVA